MKGYLLGSILHILGKLPLGFHYAFGDALSFLAEKVIRYRRSVVEINLARSFPELKYKELKELTHAFYVHFGEIIAETIWFGGCNGPERLLKQNLVEAANPEVLEKLYLESPSVMLMFSHTGNWELYGGLLDYNKAKSPFDWKLENFCSAYKKQSSEVWNNILKRNRLSPLEKPKEFKGLIESNDIIRYALSRKGEKVVYNLNTDQKPYAFAKGSVPVRFMNQDTTAMTGAARLAEKFSMSIVYLNMKRERRGHYTIEYSPICENAAKMGTEEITKRFYSLLESSIRETPANYLWSHKRWK